ncbi:MAG: hypothetical protein JWP14_3368 [Frankiales bacterium]|nr:hypothetical protein [Frankiales bacterium]
MASIPTSDPLRPASVVVAASDSTPECKAGADIVCPGTSDQAAIQAAYDAAGAGASVLLLPGSYSFDSRLNITEDYSQITGPGAVITVHSTRLRLTGAHSTISDLTIISAGSGCRGVDVWGDFGLAHNVHVSGDTGGSLSLGIDLSAQAASAIGCHVDKAFTAFGLDDDRCSVIACRGEGNVVGASVYGTECIVADCILIGGAIGGSRGDGIFVNSASSTTRDRFTGNTIVGHYVGIDCGGWLALIANNTVADSQRQGIDCYGRDSKVANNIVTGSSAETDNTYSNIRVTTHGTGNERQSVFGNTARKQTVSGTGNSAKYGLELDGVDIYASHNDLKSGGATADFIDLGSGTRKDVTYDSSGAAWNVTVDTTGHLTTTAL